MHKLVPDKPLIIADIIHHMQNVHGQQQVVSLDATGQVVRITYRGLVKRAEKLANALSAIGVGHGDKISTLAWNDQRHLEIYFAVPGLGAICHTLNPRLFPEQLRYILQDVGSCWLMADEQFIPLLMPLLSELKQLKGVIVLADQPANLTALPPQHPALLWLDYETLLASSSAGVNWPELDENTPCGCCYTSGTTGDPKGVLYSHRSTILHSMAASLPDSACLSASDSLLVIVPMFHVNAWGLPYACTMVGAKLVLPGRFMGDGEKLCQLIENEQVSLAAGVPTVLQAMVAHQQPRGVIPHKMRVLVGGAACTEALRAALEAIGCDVRPAWGMTETSPIGTVNYHGSEEHRLCPGKPVFGVELRIVDDAARVLKHDGQQCGELQIRGYWITKGYIGCPDAAEFGRDGWFATGDMARIYADGNMHITDRAKDMIKSGGEWISSQQLEDVASRHPDLATVAVIAMPHPSWDERPLLLVVAKPDRQPDAAEILNFFSGKVAKWWIPDKVQVIGHMPLTATGKIDKKQLRALYGHYYSQA